MLESGVQLVTLQLIRAEKPDVVGVFDKNLVNKLSGDLHLTLICSFLGAERFPVWQIRLDVSLVALSALPKLLWILGWDYGFYFVDDVPGFREELIWLI